jgi:hypothetical protein
MELSPSLKAISLSTTHDFPNISWNVNIHYNVHNIPPLIPILSQINPVHTTPPFSSNKGMV